MRRSLARFSFAIVLSSPGSAGDAEQNPPCYPLSNRPRAAVLHLRRF